MTDMVPERRSNRTHTWLIVVLVILGLFAISGVSLHHFGGDFITIDGRTMSDLNPFEAILAVIVGVFAAIVAVIVAILATLIGLAAGLFGLLIGLLGAALGIIVAVGVVAGPFIVIGLIVWAIVKASNGGKAKHRDDSYLDAPSSDSGTLGGDAD